MTTSTHIGRAIPRNPANRKPLYWLPYGVLLAGLLVTAVVAYHNKLIVETHAQARFDTAIKITHIWLERRMYRYMDGLQGVRALFSAS